MKTLVILSILTAGLLLAMLTGCVTASNPSGVVAVGGVNLDPEFTGRAAEMAAKLGGIAAIQRNPEVRQYFLDASLAIGVIVASGDATPEKVEAALDGITKDLLVTVAISDALDLYSDYYGKLLAAKLADKSPYTVPVLTGLSNGLMEAYMLTVP